MATSKEIKAQITSVKKTQKITRTMQMVATSKMRKAQEQMQRTRPYAQKIRQIVDHVANSKPEYVHPFMQRREIKRAAYIVVSSDRGLCGSLNAKLFKELTQAIQHDRQHGIELSFCPLGTKGGNFFQRYGGTVVGQVTHLGNSPTAKHLIGVVKLLLDAYQAGTLDALYICSNEFINTMNQSPVITQLLPITYATGKARLHWDYIYEPDQAREILSALLSRYLEAQIYCAVIENIACEQAARTVAMKNATENAKKMVDDLQLVYNKARQAGITRELAEIAAGAAAV